MTSIGSPSPFFLAGKKEHDVERSLRFNYNDSAYLNRTPTNTSNRRKFTISWWFKLGQITSTFRAFFGAYDNSTTNDNYYFWITLTNNQQIRIGGWSTDWIITNRLFRDPTAWYHCVVAYDTENSTANDRVILYVNGVRETSFATQNNPTQNLDLGWNLNAQMHTIGRINYSTNFYSYDGYMAEIYHVDGQQLPPSSFGRTNPQTGQWIPISCSANLGTNGFYLKFADNSGTTATTLGKDSFLNGNNFTPNNFSVAAGYNNDSLTDTPTHNFATLNWVNSPNSGGLANGGLNVTGSGNWISFPSTMYVSSGKWYCEVEVIGLRVGVGIANRLQNLDSYLGDSTNSYAYFDINHSWYNNSQQSPNYGANFTTGDVLGIALDMDNGTLNFYKNGTDQGQAFSGISGEYALCVTVYGGDGYSGSAAAINFGQRPFYNPSNVPSGYNTLSSQNFADSTILSPRKHFDTLRYEGNASTQSISGLLFSPDWLWIKEKDQSSNHGIFDSIRGPGKSLNSNDKVVEQTQTDSVTSFDANGFSLGDNSESGPDVNYNNGNDFVAWNWNAGDTDGKTYTVKVHDFSGNNRYIFDDFQTEAVTLDLAEGGTYIFNMDDASNASHPFSIGTAANGTVYTSGITYFLDGVSKTYNQYTSGFSAATTRRLHITVPASAPVLYYWCSVHSGMGGQINTNSTTGSSNFDGTLQTTVKTNTTAGFSIIKWQIPSSAVYTIGHGLGVAPKAIFMKSRDGDTNWDVFHASVGNQKRLRLNSNDDPDDFPGVWNDTDPTSTVFTSTGSWLGANKNIVAYAFSEVDGYSKFGDYTGNGSNSGQYVYLGFRPAIVIQKRFDTDGHWYLFDNKRNGFNVDNDSISPNLQDAEYDVSIIDFLSMGFVWKTNAAAHNASGGTYIYFAWAELPSKYSRAR